MQTLAFLSFELHVAQQRLRASFAQSEIPAKARNWNSASRLGTRRYPFVKPVPRMKSAQEPGTNSSLRQSLFQLIPF
jgi:hypothetical protein